MKLLNKDPKTLKKYKGVDINNLNKQYERKGYQVIADKLKHKNGDPLTDEEYCVLLATEIEKDPSLAKGLDTQSITLLKNVSEIAQKEGRTKAREYLSSHIANSDDE